MNQQGDDAVPDAPPTISEWLSEIGAVLPAGTLDQMGSDERAVLLDLARIAAHRSHRTAVPISTYLVGLAFAELSRAERLARLRDVVARLDVEGQPGLTEPGRGQHV